MAAGGLSSSIAPFPDPHTLPARLRHACLKRGCRARLPWEQLVQRSTDRAAPALRLLHPSPPSRHGCRHQHSDKRGDTTLNQGWFGLRPSTSILPSCTVATCGSYSTTSPTLRDCGGAVQPRRDAISPPFTPSPPVLPLLLPQPSSNACRDVRSDRPGTMPKK